MPRTGKRRICFPITSRAYYGRSQLLIRKLHHHPNIDLHLMLGGSILLDKYSRHVADDIERGGFTISTSYFNVIEGGNHVAMAKTACLTALEFTNGFHSTDPDIVVICGDRFEQLAIAMAAAYLNKTIAHIHFVTNGDAYRRVVAMGENPRYVFDTGSLDVELASLVASELTVDRVNSYGVGSTIDISKPFVMVIQHPVTTETENRNHLEATMHAIAKVGLPAIWFWPNPDAGTGEMAERIRHFREHHEAMTDQIRFIVNVPVEDFVAMLRMTACLIGNSSAGIKECSYLGTPVVNIGGRQNGRLNGEHVTHTRYDTDEIAAAIRAQLRHGRYPPSHIYYKPDASDAIVERLAGLELYTQKRFCDPVDAGVRV